MDFVTTFRIHRLPSLLAIQSISLLSGMYGPVASNACCGGRRTEADGGEPSCLPSRGLRLPRSRSHA